MTCKRVRLSHFLTAFAVFVAVLLATTFTSVVWAQNPVPLINQPLVPEAATPGGAGFTLTVNGTGFVSSSVVHWNGAPRSTHFVNTARLTANIPATDIVKASTAGINVVTPGPGGGTSGTVFFPISPPAGSVSLSRTDFDAAGGNIYLVTADLNGDGKL